MDNADNPSSPAIRLHALAQPVYDAAIIAGLCDVREAGTALYTATAFVTRSAIQSCEVQVP
ncbi:MAG TPA: hypothetical protein VMX94_05025 [Armatimonadota bacterium]|nr:hypothetical protein [Armatimonadota bacterium]